MRVAGLEVSEGLERALWARAEVVGVGAAVAEYVAESSKYWGAPWAVIAAALEARLLAAGEYVRSSAIGTGDGLVRVTFRNASGGTVDGYVSTERYHAVSLLDVATPDTFGLEARRT